MRPRMKASRRKERVGWPFNPTLSAMGKRQGRGYYNAVGAKSKRVVDDQANVVSPLGTLGEERGGCFGRRFDG